MGEDGVIRELIVINTWRDLILIGLIKVKESVTLKLFFLIVSVLIRPLSWLMDTA